MLLTEYEQPLRLGRDFAKVTIDPWTVKPMVRWMLTVGRFPMYDLAKRYAKKQDEEDEAEERRRGTGTRR